MYKEKLKTNTTSKVNAKRRNAIKNSLEFVKLWEFRNRKLCHDDFFCDFKALDKKKKKIPKFCIVFFQNDHNKEISLEYADQ